jgi:hypothetical protein
MAAGEVVAEAAEAVAEEALEVAETARGFTSRELSWLAVGSFWGTACGCVAGYFWAKRRLETKYQTLADEEINAERDRLNFRYYERVKAELGRIERGEATKKPLDEVVKELGYREDGKPVAYDQVKQEPTMAEEPPQAEVKSIFETPQPAPEEVEPDWDYAAEVRQRRSDVPFIIHRDEWNNEEAGYDQTSLTYFEEDDTLADQQDKVIDDPDKVIGLGNMLKWGHGSGDPNVLYIRNDELTLDMEVTRSMGSYASEVHGIQEDELQHSNHRIRPRTRFDDDERT